MVTYLLIGWRHYDVIGWRHKTTSGLKSPYSLYLCGILVLILVLLYRQNVVIVGAGRSSRSAKFATSSELLYLLSLLYNMPSECCDEYNLYNLNRKSSVWCFAFSHTSTFELIPAVATAQPGALVTLLTSYNTTLANHLPPSGPRISFLKIPVMISLFSTYIRSSWKQINFQ